MKKLYHKNEITLSSDYFIVGSISTSQLYKIPSSRVLGDFNKIYAFAGFKRPLYKFLESATRGDFPTSLRS